MSNYAIDTAVRFGEIPFTEFTKELINGVFDSLVESHIEQVEHYAAFINSMTQDLSTYINNTMDGVTFEQVSDFIQNYELPTLTEAEFTAVTNSLSDPAAVGSPISTTNPATTDTWWGGLMNSLAPAITTLAGNIHNTTLEPQLAAITNYNAGLTQTIPTYNQIHDSIAALIASNKYALLQNLVRQGMMRLVVTEGEVETKITFSTWNTHETTQTDTHKDRERAKVKDRGAAMALFQRRRPMTRTRSLTVNTAKSYQRDTSGTKVDIFGRVLIRFKTDYAPLGG